MDLFYGPRISRIGEDFRNYYEAKFSSSYCYFLVLEIKPRVLYMPVKCSTTKLQPLTQSF
jgi:hypothetical protein